MRAVGAITKVEDVGGEVVVDVLVCRVVDDSYTVTVRVPSHLAASWPVGRRVRITAEPVGK